MYGVMALQYEVIMNEVIDFVFKFFEGFTWQHISWGLVFFLLSFGLLVVILIQRVKIAGYREDLEDLARLRIRLRSKTEQLILAVNTITKLYRAAAEAKKEIGPLIVESEPVDDNQ